MAHNRVSPEPGTEREIELENLAEDLQLEQFIREQTREDLKTPVPQPHRPEDVPSPTDLPKYKQEDDHGRNQNDQPATAAETEGMRSFSPAQTSLTPVGDIERFDDNNYYSGVKKVVVDDDDHGDKKTSLTSLSYGEKDYPDDFENGVDQKNINAADSSNGDYKKGGGIVGGVNGDDEEVGQGNISRDSDGGGGGGSGEYLAGKKGLPPLSQDHGNNNSSTVAAAAVVQQQQTPRLLPPIGQTSVDHADDPSSSFSTSTSLTPAATTTTAHTATTAFANQATTSSSSSGEGPGTEENTAAWAQTEPPPPPPGAYQRRQQQQQQQQQQYDITMSSGGRPNSGMAGKDNSVIGANDNPDDSGCCAIILTLLSYMLVILFFPLSLCATIKVVQEYERAVIFRLGRLLPGGAKGPGIFFVMPCIEEYTKVDLRTVSFDVPPQEVLTRDSVTVSVDAVVYYRISNPTVSVANVENAANSTQLLAQTTLRNVLGTQNLAEILSNREHISEQMQNVLDDATDKWGIKVERVEIKDVRLPTQLQRAMAAEAEAARDARAKVIAAEGEQKASVALKEAADIIANSPAALQLRYLQTLNSISAEKNSTIIFPLPLEMVNGLITKMNK